MSATATPGDTPTVPEEFAHPPASPLDLLRAWIGSAPALGVAEPMASDLATVRPDGSASSRFVSLTDVTADGVVFTTGTDSPKGAHMTANPRVALAAFWPETKQQYRITGVVSVLDEEDSDRLFAELPRAVQAVMIVARQSEPLGSQAALVAAAQALGRGTEELERPAAWRGWLVTPTEVQFWVASSHHLHHRLLYEAGTEGWTARRLQP